MCRVLLQELATILIDKLAVSTQRETKPCVCRVLLQELATIFIDKLDVKIMLLNNQHLGMVVQWEDRFYKVCVVCLCVCACVYAYVCVCMCVCARACVCIFT